MSEQDAEAVEETEETSDEPADSPDGQPAIEDDEMADFGSIAEEIEEETNEADESEESEPEASDGDTSAESDEQANETETVTPEGTSLGTVYCNSLGMLSAVSRCRFGTADAEDRDELAEDYAGMARQLEIDAYLDEWVEEHGGMDSVDPGTALVLSTLLFGGMVIMEDPALAETAVEEVRAA